MGICYLNVRAISSYQFYLTFFFLDEKEPKNQEQPDRSARLSGLRTWMIIFLAYI